MTDNGYPTPKTATTTAVITVSRENAPSFIDPPPVTVNEKDLVNTTVTTVYATKPNVKVTPVTCQNSVACPGRETKLS